MFRSEDINAFFQTYLENYITSTTWETLLLKPATREEWLARLKSCSIYQQNIRQENQALLDEYVYSVKANPALLSNENFDLILSFCQRLYDSDDAEPIFLIEIAELLIPHYEAQNDIESLLFLYTCAGYSYLELSRTGNQKASAASVSYYKKVLHYRDKIDVFEFPKSREYIFIAYSNLILVETGLGNISLEEAYSLWQELCSLRTQEKFCQFDESNPRIPQICSHTFDSFCAFDTGYNIHQTFDGSPIIDILNKFTKERCEETLKNSGSIYKCSYLLVFNYYRILAKEGSISWDDAWLNLHHYYIYQKEFLEQLPEFDDMTYYCNLPLHLIDILNHTTMAEEFKSLYYQKYKDIIADFLIYHPGNSRSYTLNSGLQTICFHPLILDTFKESVEKINFIIDLVVSKHLTTFIHSVMVSYLAEAITKFILKKNPKLLFSANSPFPLENIAAHESELIDFSVRSALFHDIGKNGLIPIINTQHRNLTDFEFEIIRSHPVKGSEYLASDKHFALYHEIAYGHHKSYDGLRGYPLEFNNTTASCRSIIDLIHICDCLDAATDYLSRNYHRAKSFDSVMEELKAGRGSEYNPDIVNLILEEPVLYNELKILTEENRENIYYDTYLTFVNKQNPKKN